MDQLLQQKRQKRPVFYSRIARGYKKEIQKPAVSQGTPKLPPGNLTERYMHAAQVLFPGAAERSEARMFGDVTQPNDRD
jgi:hypothetical protein